MKCACGILLSVACRALQYFSILSLEELDFCKKFLNIKFVFLYLLQLSCKTFLILRRTEGDVIKNVYWSSCKVPLYILRF